VFERHLRTGGGRGEGGQDGGVIMSTGQIVLYSLAVITALLVIGLVTRWLVRKVGCNCHICGRRMAFFNELTPDEQSQVTSYFEKYESRFPDTSALFACRNCRIVYDDFSGEKRSMAGDNRSFCKVCGSPSVFYMWFPMLRGLTGTFRKKYKDLIEVSECLRCKRHPISKGSCVMCDTPVKVLGCWFCQTLYMWKAVDGTTFKFLVPLTEERILDRPPSNLMF